VTDHAKRISGAQIAALFGVGRSTVTEWNGQGCPSQPNPKTGAPTYLPSEVYRWRLAQAESATTPQALDKEAEQLRKLKEEADRVALENAQTRSQLVPVKTFEAVLAKECSRMRGALLKMPSMYADRVSEETGCDMATAQALLAYVADQTLTELANGGGDDE
jgi:phage terminase Nu1 subunit (DNA packaging protein)